MDANEQLKREIRAYLVKSGTTQTQLAEALGMSRSSLSNVLRGDRGLLTGNAVRILNETGLELYVREKGKEE